MIEQVGPEEPLWDVTVDGTVAHASVPETILGKDLAQGSGGGGGVVIISVGPSGDLSDWFTLTSGHPELERIEIDADGAATEAVTRLVEAADGTGLPTQVMRGPGDLWTTSG